jgi:hypothetical protein
MKEPIELIEAGDSEEILDTKMGLRRDILLIFNYWHNEPLTPEKIKELLERRGPSIKIDTLYKNLDSLVQNNILIKKQLPPKKSRGRPPTCYELNKNAVYNCFKLLEDLLDACGFDPISVDESGNTYVEKCVCMAADGVTLLPDFERMLYSQCV